MSNVTCGLTAKKPGSAPCPTLVIEYETTLLFYSTMRGADSNSPLSSRSAAVTVWVIIVSSRHDNRTRLQPDSTVRYSCWPTRCHLLFSAKSVSEGRETVFGTATLRTLYGTLQLTSLDDKSLLHCNIDTKRLSVQRTHPSRPTVTSPEICCHSSPCIAMVHMQWLLAEIYNGYLSALWLI